MAANQDEDVIGMIRQRTEEEELKQYLKSSVGGYTKSSVMEYLAEVRKRQQNSSETFNEHMQTLLEEKEGLKSENEKLLMQIAQAKADFLRLAEAKKLQEQSKAAGISAADHAEPKKQEPSKAESVSDNIVYLKGNNPEFDTAGVNPQNSDSALEKIIEAMKNEISEKEAELLKSRQEIKEHKELLVSEKLETKKQRDLASELSASKEALREELQCFKAELIASVQQQDSIIFELKAQTTEKDSRIKALSEENKQLGELIGNAQQQDGIISELKAQAADKDNKIKILTEENQKIAELTASIQEQDSIISKLENEAAEKDSTIKTLLDENVTMMQSMEFMSNSLDHMEIQNEKLVTANNALGQAFEDESKKVVKLINEKSEETVEKLILARKLEEIMGNLASYDLGANRSDKADTHKEAESKTSIA